VDATTLDNPTLEVYKQMVATLLGVPVTSVTVSPTGIVVNVELNSSAAVAGVTDALSPTEITNYLTPLGLVENIDTAQSPGVAVVTSPPTTTTPPSTTTPAATTSTPPSTTTPAATTSTPKGTTTTPPSTTTPSPSTTTPQATTTPADYNSYDVLITFNLTNTGPLDENTVQTYVNMVSELLQVTVSNVTVTATSLIIEVALGTAGQAQAVDNTLSAGVMTAYLEAYGVTAVAPIGNITIQTVAPPPTTAFTCTEGDLLVGASECGPCPAGSYCQRGARHDCPAGMYNPTAGRVTACTGCALGTLVLADRTGCVICPENYVCANATWQRPCPLHTVSAEGSTSMRSCRCMAGYQCEYKRVLTFRMLVNSTMASTFNLGNNSVLLSQFSNKIATACNVEVEKVSFLGVEPYIMSV
jgi:hypothetical protein